MPVIIRGITRGELIEQVADVGGIRMRWLERPGDGPVVVLLHGIPTSPALWRHVVPLVPRARLLAWELVGYGSSWSAGRTADLSVAAQAERLAAWLDDRGLDRVVLAGHDLGTGVAQILAVRRPERVAGLALTNGIAYDNWPIPPFAVVRALGDAIARLPRDAFAAAYAAMVRPLHDDRRRGGGSARIHWRAGYAHAEGAAAFVRQVRSLHTADTLSVARSLRSLRDRPAAVAWGDADPFLDLRYGERLAADLGAPLDVIRGGRHFTPEDRPEPVARAIAAVVEQAG